MTIEIKVPDMGESVIDATILRWIKQQGERVAAGEAVVELETDKVALEVSAQQAGVLQRILHQSGETVKVGDVLATLGSETEAPQPAALPAQAAPSPAATPTAVPAPPPAAQPAAPEASVSTLTPAAQPAAPQGNGPAATPVARRMAQQMGVDLEKITPAGPAGRITKEDVQAFLEQSAAPATSPSLVVPPPAPVSPTPTVSASSASGRGEERLRMSRRRQTIARRLVEVTQTTAMLTTFNEIDMSAVMSLRKRRREEFKQRFGVDLGYMSFFVKASIAALKAFPSVNAEIQGDEIVLKHYYDIGIAIGAAEGLVVPVLRDGDRLNFAGIEKTIRQFVDKVKDNTLSLDDLRGGTFTITNGGIYGSLMSTPILNPPQVGILGMHAIKDRPVAVEGQVVIRPMMYVALSYDHRIVDGREAVQFLVRIKETIEDPGALLLE